ncbi:MAG: hypothetical protein H6Q36_379 [Chloroflexi bacterium]|jgi:tetrahydromethanopterin S-methyltransferase subunit B|nr:hypothetical protein [Chloroflexota bacterium]
MLPDVEARDRLGNLAIFAAAAVSWVLVGIVVTTRDPRVDPVAGLVGAGLMGLAIGLTTVPLFWLAVFARHRRIAYRGDWVRAGRRGLWVGLVVAFLVALRVQGAFSLPIAAFVIVLVAFLELTLSVER